MKKWDKTGILQLADDLVAHQKAYNHDFYGRVTDCGTFACMAGLCLWRQVGTKAFKKVAKTWFYQNSGIVECKSTGISQLGLVVTGDDELPMIFQTLDNWPADLRKEYESNGPTWRVIAAQKALQRMNRFGEISVDPKKVYTRIPQLKVLLDKANKKAAKKGVKA